jgi:hypothetical protein
MMTLTAAGCADESTQTVAPRPNLFTDEAAASGIDFHHFNGMSGELYLAEIMGPGAALFDYDNDGDLDVYLVQGAMLGPGKRLEDARFPPKSPLTDRLYRNDLVIDDDGKRTLRFTDVTDASGIRATGYGMGVAAGDYDNDGWVDLYVTCFGTNRLFRNLGDGTFRDVTESAGADDPRFSTAAAFLDYDRDGRLDLFVGNYVDFNFTTHATANKAGMRTYAGPRSFTPLENRLFHNRGDGTFEDVSIASGISTAFGGALGVIGADLNDDGWTDIFVANDDRPNQLWINRRDGTFVDQAVLSMCAVNGEGHREGCMGVDAADFDDDGDEDLFITNFENQTNTLYVNLGDGLFEDRTARFALGAPSYLQTGFGTAWFDYDNDGRLDLLTVNGAVNAIVALARAGDPFPLHQRNQLFRNTGTGTFDEETAAAGAVFALSEVSRGAAFGDVDNDGDTDVLIANNNGPTRLLINHVGHHRHWLGLRLLGDDPPRDRIGAKVTVYLPGGRTLHRRARRDGSYCSANDPRVLIGLGDAANVKRVRVQWPDGKTEAWTDVSIDTYTSLRQGRPTASPCQSYAP